MAIYESISILMESAKAMIADISRFLDNSFTIPLFGKKIACLGEETVGKTTLYTYLTTEKLIQEGMYMKTGRSVETDKRRFKIDNRDIILRSFKDINGARGNYNEKEILFKECNLLFYLARADKLLRHDSATEEFCEADLEHIHTWMKRYKHSPPIFIIGNYFNTDPEFKTFKDNKDTYLKKFQSLKVVTKMVINGGGNRKVKTVIGSLETQKSINDLIKDIFT